MAMIVDPAMMMHKLKDKHEKKSKKDRKEALRLTSDLPKLALATAVNCGQHGVAVVRNTIVRGRSRNERPQERACCFVSLLYPEHIGAYSSSCIQGHISEY